MIKTYFWPSNSCQSQDWDTAINKAIESQSVHFPGQEIAFTNVITRPYSFHNLTVYKLSDYLLINRHSPGIHFVQLCNNDIPEEYQDTFPESILHIDILARLSRCSVIAILDLIQVESADLKRQLESVTYVEKSCTIVKDYATRQKTGLIAPTVLDQQKTNQLTFEALDLIRDLLDIRLMTKEP